MEGKRRSSVQLNTFFPKDLKIAKIKQNSKEIYVYIDSSQEISKCPKCKKNSNRIHSRYSRILMDLPIIETKVILLVSVRKFFCRVPNCKRKIFTERFENLIESYARKTDRLKEILKNLAFSSNGKTNEKLSRKLKIPTSRETFLRIIRATPVEQEKSKHIAIDDWAYRKGYSYGTIICNLETNRPIDIFKGRNREDLERWLSSNKEVLIATRDRSISYKAALNNICPNAMQVADRFHIVKNILETLSEYIKRNFHANIPIKKSESHKEIPQNDKAAQKKAKLYDEVQIHREKGMSIRAIAKRMKLSHTTVANYINLDKYSAVVRKKKHRNVTGYKKYKDLLQELISKGGRPTYIFRELKNVGFSGGLSTVSRWIKEFKEGDTPDFIKPTVKNSVWLSREKLISYLWFGHDQLKGSKAKIVADIFDKFPTVKLVYALTQELRGIIKDQLCDNLSPWIEKAISSDVQELIGFAKRLRKDYSEIYNAIKYPYSNAVAEGHVARLKMIKRLMYGRAKFDLLRKRVLVSL